jgi:hypothetical protein
MESKKYWQRALSSTTKEEARVFTSVACNPSNSNCDEKSLIVESDQSKCFEEIYLQSE